MDGVLKAWVLLALVLPGVVLGAPGNPTTPTAPLLLESGKLASQSTNTITLGYFLLDPADFAQLGDAALVAKANAHNPRKVLLAAANKGNAYAQLLVGLRPGGEDDMAMIDKAANQGLVRAIALREAVAVQKDGAHRAQHLGELRKLGERGSAYALYLFAVLAADDDREAGRAALIQSAQMGFTDAQLMAARIMLESTDPTERAVGTRLARRALDRGDEAARAVLEAQGSK
jgi:hypothetical protein